MKQEDKQLLLQDLSARLPYGVILNTPIGNKTLLALVFSKKYNTIVEYNDYHGNENDISEWEGGDIEFVKPYLRPMSSMTKEETKELFKEIGFEFTCNTCGIPAHYNYEFAKQIKGIPTITNVEFIKVIDWLSVHHFDFRNLIGKGLALEAPEGMYNIKEQ